MNDAAASRPPVTVVVVTYRGREFLADCLDSVRRQTLPHELLVIDNHSTDGTADLLRERFPEITVIRTDRNRGFAGAVAVALDRVDTPWVALLNDDATAAPDWLDRLLRAARAGAGIAAVTSEMRLVGADDGLLNNLGVALTADGFGYDIGLGRPVSDALTQVTPVFGFSGGAALIDVAALRSVGGSPSRFFLYYEDTDMSWRLRLAGHEIVSVPGAVVSHRHSATIGTGSDVFHFHNERNRLLMLLRCAPPGLAHRQFARFVAATGSLAVRRLIGRHPGAGRNQDPGLRLRVLASTLRMTPWALRTRRELGRGASVDRREVAVRWLGVDPLPDGRPR